MHTRAMRAMRVRQCVTTDTLCHDNMGIESSQRMLAARDSRQSEFNSEQEAGIARSRSTLQVDGVGIWYSKFLLRPTPVESQSSRHP